jgi:hypothetical protein
MPTGVRATGLDQIIRGFGVLPQTVGDSVKDALGPVWKDLARQLAIYPGELPNQRYVRTGDLGRGWTEAAPVYIVTAGGGVDARLENPVSYADQVQGDDQQTIFSGRWTLAATVLTEYEQDIYIAVEDGARQGIQRAGLA